MTIREIVSKLENIEIELSKKGIDPECEMIAELIDTIIADDLGFINNLMIFTPDLIVTFLGLKNYFLDMLLAIL